MKLPKELYQLSRQTLLACSEFNTPEILRDIFEISPLLYPFADDLPTAERKSDLVDRVIAFLLRQRSSSGEPPFQIFLAMLHDRRSEGDGLKQELSTLLSMVKGHSTSVNFSRGDTIQTELDITKPPPLTPPLASNSVKIFLSYARADEKQVSDLYQKLRASGFDPWQDKMSILPGELWEPSIKRAIRSADFFLAILSNNSVDRRGVLQKEIKQGLDYWEEKLENDIYLIPVRLEPCQPPDSLADFQWVDLFVTDGFTRLVEAILAGAARRG